MLLGTLAASLLSSMLSRLVKEHQQQVEDKVQLEVKE